MDNLILAKQEVREKKQPSATNFHYIKMYRGRGGITHRSLSFGTRANYILQVSAVISKWVFCDITCIYP